MSKRKPKKSTTRARSSTLVRPADADYILERITSFWSSARGVRGMAVAAGVAIGTLQAAKLLLRLSTSGGRLEFEGDPQVLDQLEHHSDQLADRYFEAVVRMIPGAAEVLPSIRLPSERSYLRLVKDRTDYRWSREWIEDDEPLPIDTAHLDGAQPIADRIADQVIELLGRRRELVKDREQMTFEAIGQFVAMMAAAKLVLAMWGNGKVAASFERLAELVSERDYQHLTEL